MRLIVQIDGGGIRGAIPAAVLALCQEKLGFAAAKDADLVSGQSTGAILGAAVAMGVPAGRALGLYVLDGPGAFQTNPLHVLRGLPKYKKGPVADLLRTAIGGDLPMSACRTKYMCGAVSYVDDRTHYFKSWEEKDGQMRLLDAVQYSFSAAWYFGKSIDTKRRQVWGDGGEGTDNCSAEDCKTEAERQRWLPAEECRILSLGCGACPAGRTFEEARKMNMIQEVACYPTMANRQATADQLGALAGDSLAMPLRILRLDPVLPPGLDSLDAVDHVREFMDIGTRLYWENEGALRTFLGRD